MFSTDSLPTLSHYRFNDWFNWQRRSVPNHGIYNSPFGVCENGSRLVSRLRVYDGGCSGAPT